MLVSNEISKNQYVGDGSATEFAYTFPILDATHIEVYRQLPTETAFEAKLVPTEEYTVEGAGVESGGKVVFKVAPSSGTKLSILRNVPITQLYQYQELDSFPAESHENALAKLTMICQGMDERLDRAIVVSPTDTVTPDELRNGIFEASEDAIASAAAAASSESNAANSETAAASSESNAASSASAAANSESNAASSASAAANSANAAASSASAAANSEAAAASSAASILELQVEVSTLNPGLPATGEYDPATGILTLGVPKGDPGDAAIATPANLGSVMPQTGDEDGLELETDGKLRVRKATATQRGGVLASTTAAANTVPLGGTDGVIGKGWIPVILPNSRLVITESNAAWTPPVTGWARVTVIGGGGGGNIGSGDSGTAYGGGGGAGGEIVTDYVYLEKSTSYPVVIGAGGTKGSVWATGGAAGGQSSFGTIVAMGGNPAIAVYGGKGSLHSPSGTNGQFNSYPGGGGDIAALGGTGGGSDYGRGGDGALGRMHGGTDNEHTNGTQGCIIIEYYDPEKEVA